MNLKSNNFAKRGKNQLLLTLVISFIFNVNAQSWVLISGAQRAINDSNRVNYWCDPFPCGARVTNFNKMKLIDLNDTQFVNLHLNANQVYEEQKTVTGPPFFISKYEVSNNDYLEFVEDCIVTWMKENRPEIAKKYKLESPKYLNEVAKWLANDTVLISREMQISHWTEIDNKYWRSGLEWEKITYKGVSIFPHRDAWMSDYQLLRHWNSPLRHHYFFHPRYGNYPVTCISFWQAVTYCEWYTEKHSVSSNTQLKSDIVEYRLPTELEWERAASMVAEKPSKKSSGSPVKNNFLLNSKGNYIANFRPSYNDFNADGATYPTPVRSYFPNDAGCFNMQGNVGELTMTLLNPNLKNFSSLNPQMPDSIVNIWNQINNPNIIYKHYIVKGGSWCLPEAACTIGSRTLIREDWARCDVGFRMVAVPMKK